MRRSTLFPLLAAIVLSLGAQSRADDPARPEESDPEQVLKAAGLSRSGHSYVLDGEIEAGKLARETGDVSAQMALDLQRQAAVTLNLQQGQQMVGQLQQEAMMDRQAAMMYRRSRYQSQYLNNQASALNSQAQNIQRQLSTAAQQQLTALNRNLSAEQQKIQQNQSQYEALVKQTMSQYRELASRSDVTAALRSLNKGVHPKFALGPVFAYRARVDEAMFAQLAEKGLERHKTVFQLPDETEFNTQAQAANIALREWKKAPTDSRRNELLAMARTLRAQADALDQQLATLADDEDVRDAIQELNLPKRREKYHVGLSFEAQQARKIVVALEKALNLPSPAASRATNKPSTPKHAR